MSQIWNTFITFITKSKLSYVVIIGILIVVGWLVIWFKSGASGHREVYEIARDRTWQPLTLIDKQKNITAFSDELMVEIAKEENIHIHIMDANPGTLLEGLQKENYDAIMSSLSPTPDNRQIYDFSDPYYLLGPVLIVPEWSSVESLRQMSDKIIGIPTGASLAFELEQNPTILVTPYDNMLNALDHLSNGKIDGVIMDAIRAYAYTNGFYKGRLKVATPPLTKEGLRIISLKDGPGEHLVEHFNAGLKKLIENGKYKQILQKWDLVEIQQ